MMMLPTAAEFTIEEVPSLSTPGLRRTFVYYGTEGLRLLGMAEKIVHSNRRVEWRVHYIHPDGKPRLLPISFSGPLGRNQAVGAILALTHKDQS